MVAGTRLSCGLPCEKWQLEYQVLDNDQIYFICLYPYFHIHSHLCQSSSTSSKGKTLYSSLRFLPFYSFPFPLFIMSSFILNYCSLALSRVCTHPVLSRHSREQFPWAHPLPQPSRGRVQPPSNLSGQTGGAACEAILLDWDGSRQIEGYRE